MKKILKKLNENIYLMKLILKIQESMLISEEHNKKHLLLEKELEDDIYRKVEHHYKRKGFKVNNKEHLLIEWE